MEAGDQIENYRLVRRLGGGGMGEVWEALDLSLNRPVAMKCIAGRIAADPAYLKRFRMEAHTLARLDHPGIVRIYNFVQHGTGIYLVMELIGGETLSERLRARGQIPAADCLIWFRQVASALAYAHSNRVLHRDLKPSNIMVDKKGQARLIDFGLALPTNYSTRLTRAGEILGTLPFMAPEQYRGERTDERSDVYSLALAIYNTLTGYVPVRRPDGSHAYAIPKNLPTALLRVLENCLSPWPDARYGSANDLESDIALAQEGKTPRRIPSVSPARWQAIAAIAAFAAFLLIGLGWFLGRGGGGAPRPASATATLPAGSLATPEPVRPRSSEMVEIPAGTFVCGMSVEDVPTALRRIPGVENLTTPGRRTVWLPTFQMDKFEVTNGDYALFLRATGRPAPAHWQGALPPAGKENHPVVNVTFGDAEAYAQWAGKRLPTVEEWEKAARGADGRIYPWGNEFVAANANTEQSQRGETCPVDAYPLDASPHGISGMAGNAAEWTASGKRTGQGNVTPMVCGGSWLESGIIVSLAAFHRISAGHEVFRGDLGFRCAK